MEVPGKTIDKATGQPKKLAKAVINVISEKVTTSYMEMVLRRRIAAAGRQRHHSPAVAARARVHPMREIARPSGAAV